MLKKVNEMNEVEYQAYVRLQDKNNISFNDLELIWNTFISTAKLCKSCNSMKANAYNKVIRFFNSKSNEIPNFQPEEIVEEVVEEKPQYDPAMLERMIKKLEAQGFDMRMVPETEFSDEVRYGARGNESSCLWCGTFFKKLNPAHLYCSTTCRSKMREYRAENRKLQNTELDKKNIKEYGKKEN